MEGKCSCCEFREDLTCKDSSWSKKKKKIKKSLTVKGEALSLIYPVQKGNVMLATSLKALLLYLKYELWLTHTTQIN